MKTFTVSGSLGPITAGPEGNLWFVEQGSPDKIGRITPAGAVTEFPLSTTDDLNGLVSGPDGNIWFIQATSAASGEVGRITPAGTVTEFPLPAGFAPSAITAGPDGDTWVAENARNTQYQIVQVAPAGTVQAFPFATITTHSSDDIIVNDPIDALAVGPDGNLWFGGDASGYLGEMTPSGVVTHISIASVSPYGSLSEVTSIAPGAEGDLWFLATSQSSTVSVAVGHVSAGGTVSAFNNPLLSEVRAAQTHQGQVIVGSDGNLRMTQGTEFVPADVERVSPTGSFYGLVTQVHINMRKDIPLVTDGITSGPGGTLWITEKPQFADPKSPTTYTIAEVNVAEADTFAAKGTTRHRGAPSRHPRPRSKAEARATGLIGVTG